MTSSTKPEVAYIRYRTVVKSNRNIQDTRSWHRTKGHNSLLWNHRDEDHGFYVSHNLPIVDYFEGHILIITIIILLLSETRYDHWKVAKSDTNKMHLNYTLTNFITLHHYYLFMYYRPTFSYMFLCVRLVYACSCKTSRWYHSVRPVPPVWKSN